VALSRAPIPKSDLISWVEVTKEGDGQQYVIITDYRGMRPWSHAQIQEFIAELQKTLVHITDDDLWEYGKRALLEASPSMFELMHGANDPLYVAYQNARACTELRPPKKPPAPRRGYVYILKGDKYYKIGRTANINQRLTPMTVKAPFPLEVVILSPSEDMAHTEKALHARFADKHRKGEWYDLTEQDITSIRSEYATIDPTVLQAS
jgi:Meiotically Up-regulated Gene 113 (MUG113) protein